MGDRVITARARVRGWHALAASVLVALAVLFVLWEALFCDALLLSFDNRLVPPFRVHVEAGEPARPMNMVTGDVNAYYAPETMISVTRLRAGEVPLWNEHQLMGQPQLASMGFAVFYPTCPLFLILDPLRAYAVSVALHLVLLGVGVWWLCRSHNLSFAAALLGALGAMFSAFSVLHVHLPGFLYAFAWLPWIVLAAERLARAPSRRAVGVLASVLALCLLAGCPQIAAISAYAAAVAFLVAAPRVHAVAAALVAGVLGCVAAAVLLLPGLELYQASTRAVSELAALHSAESLEPPALVGFVLPHAFGHPVQEVSVVHADARRVESFPSNRWLSPDDENNMIDNATYFGVIPFALALLALPRRRNLAYTALFSVSLLAALGVPWLAAGIGVLPGVGVGSPKRVLCVTAFAGAVLAASTLDRLQRGGANGRALAILGVGFLLLSGIALFPFEQWLFSSLAEDEQRWFRSTLVADLTRLAAAGVVLVAAWWLCRANRGAVAVGVLLIGSAAELTSYARATNPAQRRTGQYDATSAIEWMRANDARYVSFDLTEALPACVVQVFGLRSCNGYYPLLGRESYELLAALEPGLIRNGTRVVGAVRELATLSSPLLDLFGVRYVATSVNGHNRLRAAGWTPSYVGERERLAIYVRPTALQPAFLVARVSSMSDRDARLRRLCALDFVPGEEALVEQPISHPRSGLVQGPVHYTRVGPERILLDVAVDGPAFVVVSETFAPGWQATVDGQPAPLLRTDHALMGVPLPAGARRVEISYRPASFTLGAVLSVLGLLACAWLSWWRRDTVHQSPGDSRSVK